MSRTRSSILRPALIGILALALVAGSGIGTAWAYFTTYAKAQGGYTLKLGDTTEIDEVVRNNEKIITISITSGEPVYVRVQAYSGGDYDLTYTGDGWVKSGDWYYYTKPLVFGGEPEEANTLPLTVSISLKEELKDGEQSTIGDANVNIAVVYETTRALYNDAGTEFAAWDSDTMKQGWEDKVIVRKTTEGGN